LCCRCFTKSSQLFAGRCLCGLVVEPGVALQEAPQEKTLTCSTTSKHDEKFRLTAAPRPLELGKLAYAVMQRNDGKAFDHFSYD
jgi:hypothetical protein